MNKFLPTHLKINSDKTARLLAVLAILVANLFNLVLPSIANAEDHAWAALRIDDMTASATATASTGGTVMLRTGSTGSETEADVQVTFPGNGTQGAASFGVNSTAGNWSTSVTNLPAGCTSWPSIGATASGVSGATVTFASGNLAANTTYCFNFKGASTLSNPTSPNSDLSGTIRTRASGPSTIDTTTYATAIVSDSTIDVTASVPATFNFSVSNCTSNTDALSTLSTTSVTSSPTPCHVTVGTNATSGYIVWVKDLNAGLTSSSASDTINTSGTVDDACSSAYSSGTEFYGLDAVEGTDPQTNGTIDPEYACTSTTVGAYSTSYTELATGSGPTSGYSITMNNRAAASPLNKPATDYADVVTVSGAGQF